jgi:hypothetical protein
MTLVNDDELRPALAKLALVTKDLGKAQRLTALSADVAAGSGRSFESVATAMAKAAGGNVTALKRLFPQLDAGPDKVLTFKEAMDQLRDAYKGAGKEAADNDLFGRLAAAFAAIKEDGFVFAWGSGFTSSQPLWADAVSVVASDTSFAAVLADGSVAITGALSQTP